MMWYNILILMVASVFFGVAVYYFLMSRWLDNYLVETLKKAYDVRVCYHDMHRRNDLVRMVMQDFMNMNITNLSAAEAFTLKMEILKRIQGD